MKKHQHEQNEVNRTWNQIEPRELDQLRADMNQKTQTRMNGRLQSRWIQVMLDRKVVRFPDPNNKKEGTMDEGWLIVCDPAEYKKWQMAESMLAASDKKAEDSLFAANPELAVEAKERFQKFLAETRELVFSKRISNQQT